MKVDFSNNTFFEDEEKMRDFSKLTKEEFLFSYSYLTEEEYNNTEKIVNLLDYNWRWGISKNQTIFSIMAILASKEEFDLMWLCGEESCPELFERAKNIRDIYIKRL